MSTTLVEHLFANIMALLPFVIVRTYQRGVRWFLGKNPRELAPGFHWKIWFFHQVEMSDVVDEFIETTTQSVITADRKHVCFRVGIGYRIVDIVKHWDGVQDFVESTRGYAEVHLAERVRKSTLADLEADLGKLELSLRGTLTTRFRDWGTEVFSVGFTTFAEVPRQYRFFTDGPLPVINSATH